MWEHPSKDATPEEPAVVEDDSSDQESDSYIEVELPPDAEGQHPNPSAA